jgi:hypothetical protein
MPPPAVMRVLLLSEDSARDAAATLGALAREMFRLLDPEVQPRRIGFEPAGDPEARQAMRANRWRSRNTGDYGQSVALRRLIATWLMQDMRVVVFHYDADVTWSGREACLTRAQFQEQILRPVRVLIEGQVVNERPGILPGELASSVEDRLRRLLAVVPTYSIESWLYQNTREALAICAETHRSAHAETIRSWEADRGLLDEQPQPKDTYCLGSTYNLRLASGSFPAAEVHAAKKSFYAAVTDMAGCPPLVAMLAATHR